MKFYAGIGSRETTLKFDPIIKDIVLKLNDLNYTLRSGGAIGADSMFGKYAINPEIYLPWDNYNNNDSQLHNELSNTVIEESYKIAQNFHPNWNVLTDGGKKLMARNTFQILGKDLNTLSEFVICWTKDGKMKGGTSQALRIAKHYDIPIFNLFNNDCVLNLNKYLFRNANSLF